MEELIYDILDKIVNDLDNDKKVRRIIKLKEEILKDSNLNDLIKKYKSGIDSYNEETIRLKRKIIENTKVREYKELENELYFFVLEINKRLNSLIGKKGCSNENN